MHRRKPQSGHAARRLPTAAWLPALIAVTSCAALATAQSASPAPHVIVNAPVFDFGNHIGEEPIEHTFTLFNGGDAELRVLDVRTTCGCTVAGTWERAVPPGGVWELPITFDQVLAGTQFDLTPTGPAATGASVTSRTVATGLNHLGISTGDPWDGDLPLALTAGTAMPEVLLALLTAHRPGSADDGLAPATDLDLVTYGVTPTEPGALTLTLSDPTGATTQYTEGGTQILGAVDPSHTSVSVTVTPRADLELDLDVDLADFQRFQVCFGQTPTGECAQADQDQDGQINQSDFNAVADCLAGPGQTPACGG